jgi:hypothetical protein
LQFYNVKFNPYGPVVPKLKQVLSKLDCRKILDLGSGGSGPALLIQDQLQNQHGYPVEITLTDMFPDLEAFRRASRQSGGKIQYVETPVDALQVPAALSGFRTFFAAFHHFPPDAARQILADTVHRGEGIGIFEFTDRSLTLYLVALVSPFFFWLMTPLIRPFSWKRLFWTYLVPVVPLLSVWEAMASNLRTYSPAELQELVHGLDAVHYTWEIGKVRSLGGYQITYLLGYPDP